jgi:hypothetical protein
MGGIELPSRRLETCSRRVAFKKTRQLKTKSNSAVCAAPVFLCLSESNPLARSAKVEEIVMSIAERSPIVESPGGQPAEIKRIVASSVIGTAVEWYDFLIYGATSALVFNKLF